jgi:glycerol-1-phosphate dehydrogenase [NAD(P)+]
VSWRTNASTTGGFVTVFGRGLIEELPNFVHRPYLVVTMEDLWPRFAPMLNRHLAGVHLVKTLDRAELERIVEALPACASIVGLGGGQAIDVAKFFAWTRRLPLFQVPTSMTVNAPFGHRSGLRTGGKVRYVGWAVPEAVYVDFEVIQSAPPAINRAGIGDILCYHTAHFDWKLVSELGRVEARWPWDETLVAEARLRLESVLANLDEIHDVTERGMRTVMLGHRWGGTTFHDSGWNPRHIEGMEHFFYYNLERLTGGRHYIHGQPVGLGIVIGSVLQQNEPDAMLAALLRAGVDIRPEAMGVTWDDVAEAVRTLPAYVRDADLWTTAVDVTPVREELVADVQTLVESAYGAWPDDGGAR